MRRVPILAALAALVLSILPGAVAAAPASRIQEHAVFVSCDASTADGFVSMVAVVSTEFGSFGDLAFWAAPATPFEGPPTIVARSADVSGDATGISATFDLSEFDPNGDPPFGADAGQSVLSADLSPDGDPFPVSDRFRNGNRWETVTGTVQPLLAVGSLTLPGEDLADLSGCFAAEQNLTYFSTNPSAFNDRFREFNVSCSWETDDGFVSLFAFRDAFSAFGDIFISGESMEVGGFNEAILTETSLELAVDLEDFINGGTVGSAEASATLAATGETIRTVERFGRERFKVIADLYSVDGNLDVTIGGVTTSYPMDAEHCFAADQRFAFHSVRPNGPKPRALANDTPDGAEEVRLGRRISIVTGGNAFDPEAPCETVYPGETDPVDVPITFTAWWTVTGTGGELTADTAGSDFDTVLGVYTLGAAGFEQVVCVDDVGDPDFSLQARATWASDVGVTYYLQVGGYGGSTGRLELLVE